MMTVAVLLSALAASSAAAQSLGADAGPDISLVRVFLALVVCLVIAVFAIMLVRSRMAGGLPSFLPRMAIKGRIRLVESRRISPQAEVALVHCDGTEYLLLLAAGGPLLLAEQPAPETDSDKRA